MGKVYDHAIRELNKAGWNRTADEYQGKIAPWVLQLCDRFDGQTHTLGSAILVRNLFYQLSQLEPLAPAEPTLAEKDYGILRDKLSIAEKIVREQGKELSERERINKDLCTQLTVLGSRIEGLLVTVASLQAKKRKRGKK